ncbi:protein DESIGUAL 2 [Aristolochia californica]|uniref:protein DESIGUAL 2 n=1 Tax=Aristolochia californica TaxID=171875 RepID=UPI0035E18B7A
MERNVLLVCISVGFLGILAAALGFAAEAKRVKVSDVQLTSSETCKYPQSPALGLGFAAALAILMAQIIINTAAGCICCKKHPHPSSTNWTIAFVSFVVSWVTFIIAFLLLLTGAALNDQHGEEQMYFGNYCFVVKAGVFSGGSILSMASVCLGIIYYLTLLSDKNSQEPWGAAQPPPSNQASIALGQPQFPPPPQTTQQQPIFVPEDTYNRRQFS